MPTPTQRTSFAVNETSNDTVAWHTTRFVCPVVIGQGPRLFPDRGPDTALDLVESRSAPKGVTIQVYRPTGRPRYEAATAST